MRWRVSLVPAPSGDVRSPVGEMCGSAVWARPATTHPHGTQSGYPGRPFRGAGNCATSHNAPARNRAIAPAGLGEGAGLGTLLPGRAGLNVCPLPGGDPGGRASAGSGRGPVCEQGPRSVPEDADPQPAGSVAWTWRRKDALSGVCRSLVRTVSSSE
ncbi:hypothetical protein GCM10010329_45020 [Streptomyces spiroverticillatus]|uniref:Uncharacterized protein n=1 Tax=Streptomyces finlayi TaxID=67296 RepID=A0A919CBI9_9ACTN|nr:hypothetical protein GCM10010329_45020 [Streptomyces spiroverticillatus]GHC99053.1 hypothetical protein GCM10010334_42200 [Streptomyces finlayi]